MAYNRTYYSNFVSDAGITWRIEMYDQVAGVSYQDQEGTLGPKAGEMKYGSEGSKMFAPLKPSTFSFEFMVTTQNAANYIKQLKASRQERDVYVAIYRETVNGSNSPIYTPYWAGQVLMDLSDDPDIPMPYPITIKAVDGIASLKYYDYVPSTTSQLASHIYDIGDTYIPDPTNAGGQYDAWQTCIEIISNCLDYSGPFTTTIGSPNNPYIYTFARWFNGEMPNTTIDPLSSTRIKPNMFYKEENEGKEIKYKAQNCYDVLQNLCKAWGMRMYYFAGRYYFTQLNEWRIADSGTQASPVNMKRHGYTMAGTTVATSNAISRFWGQYTLPLTNTQTSPEYKNLKLTGGKYGLLPAFKRVTIDFANVDNVNSFTTFPLLPTGGTTAPTTAGTYWEFSSLGTYTFDGINDQTFFNRIYLAISNNGINPGNLTLGWAMVVRPAGTGSNTLNASPNSNGWTHYSQLDTTNTPPIQWINNTVTLNTGSMPNTPQIPVGIGNTTVDITTGTYANWPFFPASTFTAGDWEIGYYVRSDTTANALYWAEHGRFVPTGVSNPYTSPWQNNVNYQNVATTQGINASEFAPIINGAIGSASTTTNLYQTGDDTAYEEVKDIIMGDTGSNFSEGCIQIYTGTTWKASDFSGIWGIDTLAGGNSFSQQLAEDIFKAQAKSIDKFTVSTTINAENSVYWNDGTANRPQWAAPFTRFNTFSNANQGMVAKKYIMHTGSYDFLRDTWKWVLYEQKSFTVGATSTTTTTLGVNSGLSGGGGNPTPTDPNYSSIAPPPNPESGNQIAQRLLLQQQIQPVATIRVGQYLTPIVGIPSLTVTSLSVKKLPAAIFKIGDKLVLQTASNDTRAIESEDTNPQYNTNRIEFVVSANQSINAETISVTSKTIYQDISVGDTITFNAANLYSQYQNKTEGSVAGFEVDADGLTKDGVEITGWLNSDTMTGATVNNLPTALSVKNYVDNSHPAEDQTLQEVTDNGNTTTNSVMIGSTSAPSEKLEVAGKALFESVDIFKVDAAANPRLRIGRYNAETLNFDITDSIARIYHKQDELSALTHFLNISVDSESSAGAVINLGFRDIDGTNESTKLTVLDTGNVGIGTTSPNAKLQVNGNGTLSGEVQIYSDSTTSHALFRIVNNNNIATAKYMIGYGSSHSSQANQLSFKNSVGDFTFFNASSGSMTEKMRITSAGKVGIGTTNPAQLFEINGGSGQLITTNSHQRLFITSSPLHQSILYFGDTNSNSQGRVAYDNNYDDMYFNTAGAEKMRIKSSGNVGIGTTAPTKKLSIVGNDSTGIIQHLEGSTSAGATIRFSRGGSYTWQTGVGGSATGNDIPFSNFGIVEGSTSRLVIAVGGNVGIGTTSPYQKLGVNGNIQIGNQGASAGFVIFNGTNVGLWNYENGYIRLGTNGAERMRITSAGNVLIGTTTDSGDKLQVAGTASFVSNANQQHLYVQGAYGEGIGALARIKTTANGNALLVESATTSDSREILEVKNSNGSVFKVQGNGAATFIGQVTIPATPVATTDAASKSYVDAQSSTAMSVFSMLTCSTTTITSASDGVANAVVMKFDTEAITYGPTNSIVSYGSGGITGIENSQFCWTNTASLLSRYFEFQWNVTSDTNTVTNRVLSGIRIEEGILEETTLSWSEISPTTSYIYDRGSGNIKKGSTAGSILISMPAGELKRYYRMVFWKEKASNNSTKSESVLNGTQITLKQLK